MVMETKSKIIFASDSCSGESFDATTLDTQTTGVTVKSTDASVHKSIPGLPKVPQSNAVPPTSGGSGTTVPATTVKDSADASDAISL
ncbi:hypothetical protein Tco_0378435 [Tanacetum coccineum]